MSAPYAQRPRPVSLREHLLAQLGDVALPTRDHAIVRLLIEELDDDGYLSQELEDIASHLPLELEVETDELMIGLRLLQQFDPPGVGARSLPEALALQLQRLGRTSRSAAWRWPSSVITWPCSATATTPG